MITMRPGDVWTSARLLTGGSTKGEENTVSEPFRPLAVAMASVPLKRRGMVWEAFLCGRTDRDALVDALAKANASGPPPEDSHPQRWATAADVRKLMAESRWAWEGWIATDGIMGVAGFEGTGKTRFALDLCRRIHAADAWPDGQSATFPKGTVSVWLCADGHQGELVETMTSFGLPDDAVLFPALATEPYGGTDLDTEETLIALEEVIRVHRPGLVIIDTLTSATAKDLCSQAVMKSLKAPLVTLCQTHGVIVMFLLHVSKEGQALGRRIKGITRTLIHLECPDPEKAPAHLRVWVEKSFSKKPPALGVVMGDTGNVYDFEPPTPPKPAKSGRPSTERDKAKTFLRDALTRSNDQIGTALVAEFEATGGTSKTLWRAVEAMKADGEITSDGGTGTGKQMVLHLVRVDPETDPDPAF